VNCPSFVANFGALNIFPVAALAGYMTSDVEFTTTEKKSISKWMEELEQPLSTKIEFFNVVVEVSEVEFGKQSKPYVPTVHVKTQHGGVDVYSPTENNEESARNARRQLFDETCYVLSYAATYNHQLECKIRGKTLKLIDGYIVSDVGAAAEGVRTTSTVERVEPVKKKTCVPQTSEAIHRDEYSDNDDDNDDDNFEEELELWNFTSDELVEKLEKLTVETTTLKDVNNAADSGLRQMSKSNKQIQEALNDAGFCIPPVPLPGDLSYFCPTIPPPVRVTLTNVDTPTKIRTKRDRVAVRSELEESVLQQERERKQLLDLFFVYERRLAALKAQNAQLMREVALVKSGLPVPRIGR